MRLVNNEITIAVNKETYQPEIHLTVAVPVSPLYEDAKRLRVEVLHQRIGKQFIELLPFSEIQLRYLSSVKEEQMDIEHFRKLAQKANAVLDAMLEAAEARKKGWESKSD